MRAEVCEERRRSGKKEREKREGKREEKKGRGEVGASQNSRGRSGLDNQPSGPQINYCKSPGPGNTEPNLFLPLILSPLSFYSISFPHFSRFYKFSLSLFPSLISYSLFPSLCGCRDCKSFHTSLGLRSHRRPANQQR